MGQPGRPAGRCCRSEPKLTRPALPGSQADTKSSSKKVHSASLPLAAAIWEYAAEARWMICIAMAFFFLSAQSSRQVG